METSGTHFTVSFKLCSCNRIALFLPQTATTIQQRQGNISIKFEGKETIFPKCRHFMLEVLYKAS